MVFDPNPHHLRLIVIRCGQLLTPAEKNVTTLYEQTAPKLGVAPFHLGSRSSNWEAASQLIRQILITAGQKLRETKGLSAEDDLDKLYHETAIEFGLVNIDEVGGRVRTDGVNKLPAPHEMTDEQGNFVIPRKDCPQCGEKASMVLGPLCQSCEDAEGGRYKSMWQCVRCGNKDRSGKFFTQWLNELGVDFRSGSKESLGIKTYTNEGLK